LGAGFVVPRKAMPLHSKLGNPHYYFSSIVGFSLFLDECGWISTSIKSTPVAIILLKILHRRAFFIG
jgi:hypothetical protein